MHFPPGTKLGFLEPGRNYVKGPVGKLMSISSQKFFEKELLYQTIKLTIKYSEDSMELEQK